MTIEAKSPKIGRYQVLKAYNEMHNGKVTPVAEVLFMEFGWTKFSNKVSKIRLRSLYNKSSDGPKEQYPIQKLYLHYILINDMYETTDQDNPNKIHYNVLWKVVKPENYDEIIQEENEITADFVQQDETAGFNMNLLEAECLSDDVELALFIEMGETVYAHQISQAESEE